MAETMKGKTMIDRRTALIGAAVATIVTPAAAQPPPRYQCENHYDNFSVYRDDYTDLEKAILMPGRIGLVGSSAAAVSLIRAVQYVLDNNIPGDLIECGVYLGANPDIMVRTLKWRNVTDRGVWLYDTYEGMPQPTKEDNQAGAAGQATPSGSPYADWEKAANHHKGGSDWMRGPLEVVQARMRLLDYPQDRIHFVKGMVEDTIPGESPAQIALLRIDTDFYSSYHHILNTLWDRVSPRGVVIFDDYGALDGAKKAVDEFAAQRHIGWFLNRIDPHVRLVIK